MCASLCSHAPLSLWMCLALLSCSRETPSYLQFIVEHFDALPAVMVFAHGPECAWHLHVCMSAALSCMLAVR